MSDESVTSQHAIDFWRGIAANALRVLRSVIPMNGEQSAAWEIVTQLIGGASG